MAFRPSFFGVNIFDERTQSRYLYLIKKGLFLFFILASGLCLHRFCVHKTRQVPGIQGIKRNKNNLDLKFCF